MPPRGSTIRVRRSPQTTYRIDVKDDRQKRHSYNYSPLDYRGDYLYEELHETILAPAGAITESALESVGLSVKSRLTQTGQVDSNLPGDPTYQDLAARSENKFRIADNASKQSHPPQNDAPGYNRAHEWLSLPERNSALTKLNRSSALEAWEKCIAPGIRG